MTRLGSLLILLAIVILARAASAETLIASVADKCSLSPPNYREVPAADLERMLVQGTPVHLENVIITGDKLDLTKHSISSPVAIRSSLILPDLIFTDAVFASDLKFENDCFSGYVNFGRAYFNEGLDVTNSVLLKGVSLYDASANHSLTFDRSRITGGATFSRVRVQNGGYFTLVDFEKGANFIGAIFGYEGVFEGAIFEGDAAFERAEFGGSLRFRERPTERLMIPAARFDGAANFKATRVAGQANFIAVSFNNEVRMTRSIFDEAFFWQTKFLPCNNGQKDRGCNDVSFSDAEFRVVDFGGDGMTAYFAPERKIIFSGFTFRESRGPLPLLLSLLERHYDRGMYAQLEKGYRDKGDRATADNIYYERRRVQGSKIDPASFVQFIIDRAAHYVFGYGVKPRVPLMWIVLLLVACTAVLCRRDALQVIDSEAGPYSGPIGTPLLKRLPTAFLVSLSALLPMLELPHAKRWQPRKQKILLFRRQLWFSYASLTLAAKVAAWVIVTASISIFSVSDFIKN